MLHDIPTIILACSSPAHNLGLLLLQSLQTDWLHCTSAHSGTYSYCTQPGNTASSGTCSRSGNTVHVPAVTAARKVTLNIPALTVTTATTTASPVILSVPALEVTAARVVKLHVPAITVTAARVVKLHVPALTVTAARVVKLHVPAITVTAGVVNCMYRHLQS